MAGAASGLALAAWLTQALVAMAPDGLPRIDTVAIDVRVAGFALGLGVVTLMLFGLAPAFTLTRTPAAAVLAEGGRDGAPGRHLGQRAMVAVQIGLALVLLTGASLFGETLFRLTSRPLGFDPKNLAILSTAFTGRRFDAAIFRTAGKTPNFRDVLSRQILEHGVSLNTRTVDRLRALPGVVEAGGATSLPFVAAPLRIDVHVEGRPATERHRVQRQTVTESFLKMMGVPMVSGRGFQASDRSGTRVAIVSRELERRIFPGGALGERVVYPIPGVAPVVYEIVGVAENVKQRDFSDEDEPIVYAFDGQTGPVTHFVARTSGEAEAMLPAMRKALAEVTPQLVVLATTTGEIAVRKSIADERFRATLSIAFGATALILAAVGLYGLAARRAAARRREFGVRVALGARPANVRAIVVRDALTIVAAGLAVGIPAAFVASQATSAFLFGVSATAPHTFLIASAVLAVTAMAATVWPARRAGRQDPILALKE